MKELPILFGTPMVQANLEGRKTNTRRLKGLEKINEKPDDWQFEWADFCLHFPWTFTYKPSVNEQSLAERSFYQEQIKCPYGQPGDVLWVRETWMHNPNIEHFPEEPIYYKASKSKQFLEEWPKSWKPSIHMKKEVARIWLQVEKIRVERLHDISEEDILNEGIQIPVSETGSPRFILGTANSAFSFLPDGCLAEGATPPTRKQILFAFWAELWCKINGRESWDLNPWVWVVKYKVLSTTGKPQSETYSTQTETIH